MVLPKCNALYTTVADRFTRTKITYSQVTLPPYLKNFKKLSLVEMLGVRVHGSHKSKCYRLPIYNFVSYDYNWTFSHTAAILDSKMVSIIAFQTM